jgi:hypothetical protein
MSGIDLRRSSSRRLSDERRVIFPSLYNTSPRADEIKQTSKHHHTHSPNSPLPRSQHTPPLTDNIIVHVDQIRGMNIKESKPKQFTAATAPQISPRGPVIERSNSLDDLLISLPNLSLSSNNDARKNTKSTMHTIMPTSSKGSELRNEQTKVEHQRAVVNRSIFQPRWPLGTPTNCNGHKTFYPAASVPIYHEPKVTKPGRGGLSNNERKTPPSILRSKGGRPSSLLSSESGAAKTLTTNEEMIISTPQQTDISLATQNQLCLSPDMPTLASPTSIKTLGPNTRSNAGNDTLNESEVVQRISDMPKLLLKPKRPAIKRNQSDTAVCKKEGGERQRLRKISEGSESDHEQQKKRASRHPSFECLNDSKKSSVGFDPHIWIFEYKPQWTIDELWFSDDELTEFKQEAIQRVRLRSAANEATVIPTGTGRVIEVPSATGTHPGNGQSVNKSKAVLFNHPALSCDDEMDNDEDAEKMIQDAVSREIRNVLLVDHEICLALFTKSLKYMLGPHISITTARSGEEAITRIDGCRKAFPLRDGGSLHGFDLIFVEERLGSFPMQSLASIDKQSVQSAGDDSVQRRTMKSGSALIRSIAQEEQNFIASGGERGRCALLIGVSARFTEDQDVLRKSGADILWGKPPPAMDKTQRNHLLKVLMKKRGREMLNIFD